MHYKITKTRLSAGLRPDLLGQLTALSTLPDPIAELRGGGVLCGGEGTEKERRADCCSSQAVHPNDTNCHRFGSIECQSRTNVAKRTDV